MSGAVVHDDAGAFPRLDEELPLVGAVELQNQIVEIIHGFNQGGDVRLDFPEQGAAIYDFSAGQVHHFC